MRFGYDGDLDVDQELSVTGTVTGSIRVHAGGVLVLLGLAQGGVVVAGGGFARIAGITNGLFVAAGGHVVLTGTCQGSATNDGGELVIEGVVTDGVVEHAGTTTVRANAHHPPEETVAVEKLVLSSRFPSRRLTRVTSSG
jgi:hypothetical protein